MAKFARYVKRAGDDLYDLVNYDSAWHAKLSNLATLAQHEDWKGTQDRSDSRKGDYPILLTYLRHTYMRLSYLGFVDREKLWILKTQNIIVFDTGLFTKEFNRIFAVLKPNKNASRNKDWVLDSFCDEYGVGNISHLPERAYYVTNTSQLIFDTTKELRFNAAHVIRDENNRSRIPKKILEMGDAVLINSFEGAKKLAMKRVLMNYKTAVPQYYDHRIQLLLPLALIDFDNPELALVVNIREGFYEGRTCLTMAMAYNNARLIARPDSDWLKP